MRPLSDAVGPDPKTPEELREHMLGSYFALRLGLVVIGYALPVVVFFGALTLHHVYLQPSISSYYYAATRFPFLTARDLFVGGLFAAAACLYLYKGYGRRENLALNMAAIFAMFVAVLPTAATKADRGVISMLHGASAVLFFLCIAYVSLRRSGDTLALLPEADRPKHAKRYRGTGIAMILSPLGAVVSSYLLGATGTGERTFIFCVETLGVWAFATYWLFKTLEIRDSHAEKKALGGELKREVVPAPSAAESEPGERGAPRSAGKAPRTRGVERIVEAN